MKNNCKVEWVGREVFDTVIILAGKMSPYSIRARLLLSSREGEAAGEEPRKRWNSRRADDKLPAVDCKTVD